MKNTCKILALVLVVLTVLMSVSVLTVSAAAGQTWTVAGVKALCGTDWDTANKNNDMTYDEATDSYVKVFTNVKAGNYQFKCARDHKWDVAYPSSNYNLKVEKDGSTVTITLKGTTVTAKVEAPACDHKYEVTAATVTCLTGGSRTWTCSVCNDSYTEDKLDALGHSYDESGKCIRCDATTEFVRVYVENAAKWTVVYCYTWDTNPYVAWPGAEMTLDSESGLYYYDIPKNFVNVIFNNGSAQSADLKTPTTDAVVYNNSTKVWGKLPHTHNFVEGKCECGEEDPNYVPPHVNALVVGDTNKIVIDDGQDNGYGYYIELVPFVAEETAYYSFAGEGLTIWLYDATNALVSMTGAANLEAGTYYVFIAANTPATTGEFNVAVTKSAWVNSLAVGANKLLITDAQDNGYGYYIVWVPFEVTEKANYTFTGEGIMALVYDAAYQAVAGTALEVGTYNICVAFLTPATTGVATVNVEKTAIVPEYNWWVSDGSLYTVEGDTIKYNGAGNTYACVGCDVTALAAGKNTFTITITNNGAAAARVRVDLQATVQVGNHKVVNTEAVGGDVWTDAEWGGSIVTVPAGESVTLVITYDETTERGAVKDLIIFADSARGDAETYAADITVSGMEFTGPAAEDDSLALGDNTVVIDGTEVNLIGNAIAWYTFTPEAAGTYTFACADLTVYIYPERNLGVSALGNGVAELEAGVLYYILVGKSGVTGEFTVNVSAGGEVLPPNTIVVGDNHYVISDALMGVGFEFIEFTVAEPGTYVVTGGAPMKVYVFTLPNVDLATASAGAFGVNIDAMTETGLADSFEVVLPEAGTYWFGVNYEFVTTEREFDINISLKEVEEPKPEDPKPEEPKDEEPKDEAPEMNFFQKIIAWFMDLIQKLLAMFKK